jgi:Holliday junction DNA helicase RuvB
MARYSLEMLEVDERGLNEMDRRILSAIIDKFSGGPVGIGSLAVAVSEESDTIEDVYEPFLIQEGLLQRTQRGRIVTEAGYRHLGAEPPAGDGKQGRIL